MKAMILAAGLGARMRPLTDHTPKPLLPVGGKPLIVWHLEKLRACGFKDVVINIAWLGGMLPEALGDGRQFGLSIQYSDERDEGVLETGGGIIKALPLLGDEPFLVVNGDIWCDYDFQVDFQLAKGDLAHLILVDNPPHHPEGDFLLQNGRVLEAGAKKLTFSGIGYYHPELFSHLEYGKRALAPVLREAMRIEKASGEQHSGVWLDIGTPERLSELDRSLL